ncbi:hypothetical protein [Nocardia puris]|uniref:Uncharacterized protein n=1 Tax=Nocardia puris TaxID=208602 RepID=A0A366CW57_9NOCA|nr:hypothetical protein [Nocardia puris]RBO82072.1 hypothetical protein DFR74_12527 [Nocardia puris]
MAPLVSATELGQWKQLDALDTDAANLAVAGASGMVRAWCGGWSISQETVTGAVLDGPGSRSLWLPTLRLTAVSSVAVNGETLTVGTQYDWTGYGKLIHRGCWPNTPRSITITYTHGWNPVPDEVKTATLIMAGMLYDNPDLLASYSEAWGPFNESRNYGGSGAGLPVPVAEMLGRYQLEHVG